MFHHTDAPRSRQTDRYPRPTTPENQLRFNQQEDEAMQRWWISQDRSYAQNHGHLPGQPYSPHYQDRAGRPSRSQEAQFQAQFHHCLVEATTDALHPDNPSMRRSDIERFANDFPLAEHLARGFADPQPSEAPVAGPSSSSSTAPERSSHLQHGELTARFRAQYGESVYQDYRAYHRLAWRGKAHEATPAQREAARKYTEWQQAMNPQSRQRQRERQNANYQESTQARQYANGHLEMNLRTADGYRSVNQVHAAITQQHRPNMTRQALRRKAGEYAANPSDYVSDGRDEA